MRLWRLVCTRIPLRASIKRTAACPVDAPKRGLKVEAFRPPDYVVDAVELIAQTAGVDVGGIEYIIDDRDGRLMYYDINALSNFVAKPLDVLGWEPHERLVDHLEAEIGRAK